MPAQRRRRGTHALLLVGAASRLHGLPKMLESLTGLRADTGVKPEEAVALGAAAARDEAARDASRDGRGGVGAFARGVGGTLMTIPDAATMNARSCAGDPALGETYVELARRGALDARTATMCMLMIERRRGEAL